MRTMLRSKVTLLFIVCAALLAFAGMAMAQTTDTSGSTAAAPTIQSDKADYAPGELVTLTGSGWQAGESVNIYVEDDQGKTWSRNADVTADANGNISDSFNLPSHFVATYSVKATGASGAVATTSFTDALQTSTTVSSSPNPSSINQQVTFTGTVSCNPANNGCVFASTNSVDFVEGANANCNGGTTLGTVSGANFTGSGSSRTATFNHTFSTSGSKSIRACFNGGGPGTAAGNSVSAAHNHVVNAVTTTSVSNITASTSTFGGTTNLSAKVSPSGAPGSVAFFVDGSSTAATGTVNYDSTTGVATLSNYSHGLAASATPYSVKAVFTPSGSGFSSSTRPTPRR